MNSSITRHDVGEILKAHTDHSPEVMWMQLLHMPTLYGILLVVMDVALMGKNIETLVCRSYWSMRNTASSALFISSAANRQHKPFILVMYNAINTKHKYFHSAREAGVFSYLPTHFPLQQSVL